MDFIKNNYSSKISLDLISKHCYCNPAYLSYLFKKETGISITDYINRCRVEHAKHLLDVTDLTIAQISGAVGFNDPSYFSKIFKKMEGVWPTHYRFTEWNGSLVIAANDASLMENPFLERAQSNLWFGKFEDLQKMGKPAGWGGVWNEELFIQKTMRL